MLMQHASQHIQQNIKTISAEEFTQLFNEHGVALADIIFKMPYKPSKANAPLLYQGRGKHGSLTSLLCWALCNGRRDLAVSLLNKPVNVNYGPSGSNISPLQIALETKDPALAIQITENPTFDLRLTGLYAPANNINRDSILIDRLIEIVKQLVSRLKETNNTPEHAQYINICRMLFSNVRNKDLEKILRAICELGANEFLDALDQNALQAFSLKYVRDMFASSLLYVDCPAAFLSFLISKFQSLVTIPPQKSFIKFNHISSGNQNYNSIHALIMLIDKKRFFEEGSKAGKANREEVEEIKRKCTFLLSNEADPKLALIAIIESGSLEDFKKAEQIFSENNVVITASDYATYYLLAKYGPINNLGLDALDLTMRGRLRISDYILDKVEPVPRLAESRSSTVAAREARLITREIAGLYARMQSNQYRAIDLSLLFPALLHIEDLSFLVPFLKLKDNQGKNLVRNIGKVATHHAPELIISFLRKILAHGYHLRDGDIVRLLRKPRSLEIMLWLMQIIPANSTMFMNIAMQVRDLHDSAPNNPKYHEVYMAVRLYIFVYNLENNLPNNEQNEISFLMFANKEAQFRVKYQQAMAANPQQAALNTLNRSLINLAITLDRENFIAIIWELGSTPETHAHIIENDRAHIFNHSPADITESAIQDYLTTELEHFPRRLSNIAYFLSLFSLNEETNKPLIIKNIMYINKSTFHKLVKLTITTPRLFAAAQNIRRGLEHLKTLCLQQTGLRITITNGYEEPRFMADQLLQVALNPDQSNLQQVEWNLKSENPDPDSRFILAASPSILDAAAHPSLRMCEFLIDYDPKALTAVGMRKCPNTKKIYTFNALDVALYKYGVNFLLSREQRKELHTLIAYLIAQGVTPILMRSSTVYHDIYSAISEALQLGLLANDAGYSYHLLPKPANATEVSKYSLPADVWRDRILPFAGIPKLTLPGIAPMLLQWGKLRSIPGGNAATAAAAPAAVDQPRVKRARRQALKRE